MKVFRIRRRVVVGMLLLLTANIHAADWLFRNGKSSYQIVVSTNASTSEQTAARELQQHISQMSGIQRAGGCSDRSSGTGER